MADTAPRALLLVRHGRTAWNAEGRAQGHADIPLDEVGRQQTAELARKLAEVLAGRRLSGLWSSDLARASDTAAGLASRLWAQIRYDARLREFDVGARQGLTAAEYAEKFPGHDAGLGGYLGSPTPVGAEEVEQVRHRMSAAMTDVLAALEPGETGIVVTHGAALRAALPDLLDWPWEQVRSLAPVRNCHWVEITVPAAGDPVLVAYNTSA